MVVGVNLLREGLDLGLRYSRPQLGNSERLVVRVAGNEMVVLISPPDPNVEIDEFHALGEGFEDPPIRFGAANFNVAASGASPAGRGNG